MWILRRLVEFSSLDTWFGWDSPDCWRANRIDVRLIPPGLHDPEMAGLRGLSYLHMGLRFYCLVHEQGASIH